MSQNEIVEWAPFQLAPGVTEERLLEASSQLQESFLAEQPGFVRRELLRDGDRSWVDVVWWTDRDAAMAAMNAASNSPACHMYFGLMAGEDHTEPGAGVLHFARVASYPPNRG